MRMPHNTTLLQALLKQLTIYDSQLTLNYCIILSDYDIVVKSIRITFMFKIKIIALGKFKEKAYKELEAEFLKRLSPFAKVKVIELPEIGYGKNQNLEKIKEQEAEKIIKQLPEGGVVVLLEEKGTVRTSKDFAAFLERIGSLNKELVFVIGSGIGLHESLHRYSNYSASLSPLTFPHNMARVILEEQIYRACTILAGKEYHK
jgi:23S rRNA (pseudouridine1915-N3)-methyltransferase